PRLCGKIGTVLIQAPLFIRLISRARKFILPLRLPQGTLIEISIGLIGTLVIHLVATQSPLIRRAIFLGRHLLSKVLCRFELSPRYQRSLGCGTALQCLLALLHAEGIAGIVFQDLLPSRRRKGILPRRERLELCRLAPRHAAAAART